jgi:hypothetical protein
MGLAADAIHPLVQPRALVPMRRIPGTSARMAGMVAEVVESILNRN